jgi:hypothetical protein
MHDVQRGLNLSSVSVAQYHIKKLLEAGLAKEEPGGYSVDRVVFENMIRIRRSLIPFKVAYCVFFATMIGFLVFVLLPKCNPVDIAAFALLVSSSALALFLIEALRDLRKD